MRTQPSEQARRIALRRLVAENEPRFVKLQQLVQRELDEADELALLEAAAGADSSSSFRANKQKVAQQILLIVSEASGISTADITGSRRYKDLIVPRHVAITAVRAITGMSLPEIGRFFGRDHSTISVSIEKAVSLTLSDEPSHYDGLMSAVAKRLGVEVSMLCRVEDAEQTKPVAVPAAAA